MKRIAFPEFGRELQRGFAVAEQCYDCATFYDGCRAWPESKPFACGRVNRLPDVKAGSYGQTFPPSRVSGHKEPVDLNRLCGCGEPLPKHKRLCDQCRVQNRRQTMREQMRARRAAGSKSQEVSDVPLSASAMRLT